jgi:hypothetical protein
MDLHKNARLTVHGRERIVRQVMSGQTPKAAALAVGVCPRTIRKMGRTVPGGQPPQYAADSGGETPASVAICLPVQRWQWACKYGRACGYLTVGGQDVGDPSDRRHPPVRRAGRESKPASDAEICALEPARQAPLDQRCMIGCLLV